MVLQKESCRLYKSYKKVLLKVKKDRDIMAMRCNGYSNEEIAKLLNISKGNVESRVSRSLTMIRNILKRDIEYYEKRRSI